VRSDNQQQRCGSHDHTVASWHPSPAQQVCKGSNSPRGEQQVQHPEENECTWSDEENEQLCSAAKEHQEKGRTREGEHWRKKERGATTVATAQMPESREKCGE
jgi:hypothetical protein